MAGKTGPAVARVDEQNRVRDQRRPPVACAYQNDENSRAKLQNVRGDSSASHGRRQGWIRIVHYCSHSGTGEWAKSLKRLAPQAGFEPATLRLTAGCSAVELLRNVGGTTSREAQTNQCSRTDTTGSTAHDPASAARSQNGTVQNRACCAPMRADSLAVYYQPSPGRRPARRNAV
jgi:hypothetical protein